MATERTAPPLLKMEGIHKWFGKVHALKGVDVQVDAGEVVAIIGDNGAGKSTLIKILVGLIPKNKGTIYWKGERAAINSIDDSRRLGIEAVYQDQAVVNCLSVSKNVFLGRELTKKIGPFRFLDTRKMQEQTEALTQKLGLDIATVDQEVRFCSGGERQGVAISRAMYYQAALTILDEPVTALSLKGTKQVLEFITQLKERKIGVILISHNIGHAYSVADRFILMSKGEKVEDLPRDAVTMSTLEDMCVVL
ncbi:ATP-binding cassette domain-containing protein [candidate division KSB3 bacterium]|uniref:ATP-binding cassette domain-containing protein n=1 Tax=candidate division KSB3 bacterium TaxID=2044937 RepID=A0A9D5JXF0_9BACT|nr:ATP-binding cassette domain-containing protein [candidate division KSB3 bacterium]MBD3325496.1 ATP-binding cassette domain-containing protein [candidate division KSB3 bacterium]